MTRLTVLALLVGARLAAPAAGQPPATKPAAKAEETPELKAYPLTGADVNEVVQVYPALFARLAGKGVPAPRVSLLAKSKTLLVRGTKGQLEATEAVLAVLQGPPGGGTPSASAAKGPQLVPLKAARVDEVLTALQALELAEHVIPLRAANALVLVPATEAAGQQVKQVIDLVEKSQPPAKAGAKAAANNG